MKLKLKSGESLLFNCKNGDIIDCFRQRFIINFADKNTYLSFRQKQNHVLIETTGGEVDLVFTGVVPILEYDSFCKDQLVIKVIQGQ